MISKICRDGHGEHQKVLLYTCHDDGETLQSFASRMTGTAREAEHRDAMVAAVPGVSWRAPAGPGSEGLCLADSSVTQVSYKDSLAFAAWAGGQLPTELE